MTFPFLSFIFYHFSFSFFHFLSFYFKNLTSALIASLTNPLELYPLSLFCLKGSFGVPKHFNYRDVANTRPFLPPSKWGRLGIPPNQGGAPKHPPFLGTRSTLGETFPHAFTPKGGRGETFPQEFSRLEDMGKL